MFLCCALYSHECRAQLVHLVSAIVAWQTSVGTEVGCHYEGCIHINKSSIHTDQCEIHTL